MVGAEEAAGALEVVLEADADAVVEVRTCNLRLF